MKLLICTQAIDTNHPILGFFHGWVLEFSRHFDEVHVVCLQKGTYDLPKNVFVYSLGKEEGENKLKYLIRFYRYFARIFFRIKVDYVFFHMGAIYNILAAPFFLLRKIFNTKFYWWKAHGYIGPEAQAALLFVDNVYTSTESGFSRATSKKRIVGQAIPTEIFVLPSNTDQRNKEIIYVGRIMPVKHIEDFIDTAKILLLKHDDLRFSIIGPVGDALYFKKLQEKIQQENMGHAIQFVDSKTQNELVGIYQKAAFFLNTSLTQSMDKTVLEAALCGCLPVTANKAFEEFLGQEKLYAKQPTAERYADLILNYIEQDTTTLRHQLREKVVMSHSLETFTKRVFNI